MLRLFAIAVLLLVSSAAVSFAQDPPQENDYYKLIPIPVPEDIVLEAGAIEILPEGKIAYATRRGDVYIIEGVYNDPPESVKFTHFAEGLHEGNRARHRQVSACPTRTVAPGRRS